MDTHTKVEHRQALRGVLRIEMEFFKNVGVLLTNVPVLILA
jgi:hypothetical protein